jgi:hypothetical protein
MQPYWAPVVAVIAALASAGAAWISLYVSVWRPKRPFAPHVTFGSPILNDFNGMLSITLAMRVSNSGGRAGSIGDMVLSLQSKTSRQRWALTPLSLIDTASYLRAMEEKRPISSSIIAPFSSILLPVNASESVSVLFMPRSVKMPEMPPLRPVDLVKGDTYEMELQIVTAGEDGIISANDEWNPAYKLQFLVKQEHMEGLKANLAVFPLDTVRDALREKFLRL